MALCPLPGSPVFFQKSKVLSERNIPKLNFGNLPSRWAQEGVPVEVPDGWQGPACLQPGLLAPGSSVHSTRLCGLLRVGHLLHPPQASDSPEFVGSALMAGV